MLITLNLLFFVFHTAWMIFNMLGWAWRRTRPFHLQASFFSRSPSSA